MYSVWPNNKLNMFIFHLFNHIIQQMKYKFNSKLFLIFCTLICAQFGFEFVTNLEDKVFILPYYRKTQIILPCHSIPTLAK